MRKESKHSEPKEIDFGKRKISKMNFSHIVTIPKRFIQSTRYEKITSVRVIMSNNCLKLVPVRAKNGDEEIVL